MNDPDEFSENIKELFEERAAICEFEAGITRGEAEKMAAKSVLNFIASQKES